MNPEENGQFSDIEYIAANPGSVGWISAESFKFSDDGEFYLDGTGKVLKNPNKQNLFVFELSNDENKLFLNISLISNESLQKLLQYRDREFRNLLTIARNSIENKTEFKTLLNEFGGVEEDEEDGEEYDSGYDTPIQIDEIITEYTNLFTENLINSLYNVHVTDDVAGDIVDDMLAGLFGSSSVKDTTYNEIPDDPEFYTENSSSKNLMTKEELDKLQLTPKEADFDEYSLDEKPKENFTIEEFITNLTKQTGMNVEEEPPNPLQPSMSELSACIKYIYEAFNYDGKKQILENNKEFNNILDLIFDGYTYKDKEKMLSPEIFFIDNIVNNVYNNTEEIVYDLNEIEGFLNGECDFLLDILDLNEPAESPFRKHIKIKYAMKKSLNEYMVIFNSLNERIRLEFDDDLDNEVTIPFFTTICAITYNINKLRVKIKGDIESKNNEDKEHYDQIKNYEEKTLKLCEDFMSKMRKFADEGIG